MPAQDAPHETAQVGADVLAQWYHDPMHAGTAGPHGADFADAHRRHWEDAELLFDRGRWPNADQLYGLSAECGLKAVVRHLVMPAEMSEYLKHLPKLWSMFKDCAKDRGGGRYLQLLPGGEPFEDWSIHDRYAHRRHFDQGRVGPHREAAREIRVLVNSMEQDGGA